MRTSLLTYSQKDLFKALCSASANGRLEKVKYLLTHPVVREKVADDRNKALRLASENGRCEVVSLLLTFPSVMADVAALDHYALRYASENGHLEIVKRLLTIPEVRSNAAINQNHALRWASANGHLDIVNCLLEINTVCSLAHANDNQALKGAVYRNNHDVAARLLRVPAVLNYMKENQPTFVEEHRAFFDQMLRNSQARAILPRKLAEQRLTQQRLPFDIIVKILEKHSHAVICAKSQCDKSTWADGQPYCTLVYNYANRVKHSKPETQGQYTDSPTAALRGTGHFL